MKRIALTIVSLVLASGLALALEPSFTVKLYPDGQNSSRGISENGRKITDAPFESNGLSGEWHLDEPHVYSKVADPFIQVYLPEDPNGQMVVICPGGGYVRVASGHEGKRVAEWLADRGIASAVLVYRIPNHHEMVPLTDVQNAMRYCRAHASEWHVNSIGVMGFSAGGHLAATAANKWTDRTVRPDFSVLFYSVLEMSKPHQRTYQNLVPVGASDDKIREWCPVEMVSDDTPPTFLALSWDDRIKPSNSLSYYAALQEHNVPAEIHILSAGGHGWGFGRRWHKDKDGRVYLGEDKLPAHQRASLFAAFENWLASIK